MSKMNATLFARQPIFDRQMRVYGYELLYRKEGDHNAEIDDGCRASVDVLVNAFTEMDIRTSLDSKKGFVNFTRELLGSPPAFVKKHLVIEVLESIDIDNTTLKKLVELKKEGFTLALDDYQRRANDHPLLNLADIVKLDLTLMSQAELEDYVVRLEPYNVTLLAEKVETAAEYEFCKQLGFELFQGYFFARPQLMKAPLVQNNRVTVLNLMSKIYHPKADLNEIYQMLATDAVLSSKLLKLVNSALYRRAREVDSIHQAVTLLGLSRLQSWVALLVMSGVEGKPIELQKEALYRAYLCEFLGKELHAETVEVGFTIGLLSLLDAFYDQPMAIVLEDLPLNPAVKDALLNQKGQYGELLRVAMYLSSKPYKDIDWQMMSEQGIDAAVLEDIYIVALQKARDTVSSLQG